MRDLPRFVQVGDERININEIVSYGVGVDEDDDRYMYVETKTSEDVFQYYEEDADFDLDEKIDELDNLLLVGRLGRVDFQER